MALWKWTRRLLAALGLAAAAGVQAGAFNVVSFSPWASYAIPNGVWLSGDFNGDGRTDIVHAVNNADHVHTWMSNGDGRYTVGSFRPWAGYAIPNGIWLAGDVDGDGRTDIVHAVQGADYVNVWRSNGVGGFTVTSFRPWAGYGIPNGLWMIGDVNGDGRADLVHAVQGTDIVHTWLSNGNGSFAVATFRPWAGYAIPNGVWMLADLNGDGRQDLVHVVQGTDIVHTWMSNGNGTYAVGTFRPWAGYRMPNGEWLVADIDGDRRADLIHAVQGTDYVHVWRSNGNGSFAVSTFRPWAGYAIPNGVWRVGDFNGDGRADILHAVAGTNFAHIWLGNGNGTFTVTTHAPWAGYAMPNGLWLTGDVNGDRKTDVMHAVHNSAWVNTWLSTLPRPGEASVDALEVKQAIQDLNHTVPQVADKPTVARVYLNYNGPATALTATLQGRRGAGAWVNLAPLGPTTVNPGENFNLRARREDAAKSLNFRLPASWDDAGALQLRVSSVRTTAGAAVTCSDCASVQRSVSFLASAPLRLRVLGLRYSSGSPPVQQQPSALDYALVQSWLRRAYPISTLNFSSTTLNATAAWPFACGDANAQAATVRATDVANGTDRRTHYYALVADGGGFMRGCAAAIPGSPAPQTVASGPTGSNTFGWDTDGSYGDWYTGHELGHTFGRLHPGSGCGDSSDDANEPFPNGQISGADGAFVGWDMGDAARSIPMRALPGVAWKDVMSYCSNQWISHYTYTGIRDRLGAENTLPAGMPAPGASPADLGPAPAQARAPAIVTASQPRSPVLLPGTADAPPEVQVGQAAAPAEPAPAGEAPPLPEPAQAVPEVQVAQAAPSAPRAVAGTPTRAASASRAATQRDEAPALQRGNLVSVVATVNFTRRSARLESVARVSQGLVGAPSFDGLAAVRFLDAAGRELSRVPVALGRNTDIPANEDQTGLIDAVVPVPARAQRLELVFDGRVIDGRDIGRAAPRVQVAEGQARGAGPGAIGELSWTASHAEGRAMTYSVLVSTDQGRSWQTVATGLTETRYTLDRDGFDASVQTVRVRVIANDGFNTTVVTRSQPVRLR